MTTLRTISLPLHGALELLLGVIALVAPFALGLTAAATVVCVVIGALAIGLALDATQTDRVSAHHAFDYGLAFGSVATALAFAIAGDGSAAIFLLALGLGQLALNAVTRYSVRG